MISGMCGVAGTHEYDDGPLDGTAAGGACDITVVQFCDESPLEISSTFGCKPEARLGIDWTFVYQLSVSAMRDNSRIRSSRLLGGVSTVGTGTFTGACEAAWGRYGAVRPLAGTRAETRTGVCREVRSAMSDVH